MTNRKRIISAILLFGCVSAVIGFPLVTQLLMSEPRLGRAMQAWWMGAEYLGEDNVIRQHTAYDCGVACLQMALREQGIITTLEELRRISGTTRAGTSLLGLKLAAEANGVTASAWRLVPRDLEKIPLPAIAFVEGDHFVLIEAIDRNGHIVVNDPARGKLRYRVQAFNKHWRGQVLLFGEFFALAGSSLSQ